MEPAKEIDPAALDRQDGESFTRLIGRLEQMDLNGYSQRSRRLRDHVLLAAKLHLQRASRTH